MEATNFGNITFVEWQHDCGFFDYSRRNFLSWRSLGLSALCKQSSHHCFRISPSSHLRLEPSAGWYLRRPQARLHRELIISRCHNSFENLSITRTCTLIWRYDYRAHTEMSLTLYRLERWSRSNKERTA